MLNRAGICNAMGMKGCTINVTSVPEHCCVLEGTSGVEILLLLLFLFSSAVLSLIQLSRSLFNLFLNNLADQMLGKEVA